VKRLILTLTLVLAIPLTAQDRFTSGELKGFTRSGTEWFIDRIPGPINVRSVRGTVTFQRQDDPLEDVLFEIRGSGNSGRIRSGTSDSAGRFKISRVPQGTYAFKATKGGFSSVTGTLIVSKRTDRAATIQIAMPIGN
jgi:hypothetical protein